MYAFRIDRSERFYKIEQMLHDRRVVPPPAFLEALEVSRATFKRDLEYLRDRFSAPVVWDRDAGGYRFDAPARRAPRHELPGLWFNPSDIRALLTMLHLLSGLEPGPLSLSLGRREPAHHEYHFSSSNRFPPLKR